MVLLHGSLGSLLAALGGRRLRGLGSAKGEQEGAGSENGDGEMVPGWRDKFRIESRVTVLGLPGRSRPARGGSENCNKAVLGIGGGGDVTGGHSNALIRASALLL